MILNQRFLHIICNGIFLMLMKMCDILRIILLNLTHYRDTDVCDLIDSVYDTESTISTHNL